MQVAIDTSTEYAGLALMQDGKLVAELSWRCGRSHSTQLLPSLERLLEQTGLSLETANCVIVARGPGSYNGLRAGISAAKGLAFSLGIPLVSVSTLEAEAYQYAERGLPICPILNAGREEITTATYQQRGNRWLQIAGERLTTVEGLCSDITTRTLVCGQFVAAIGAELKSRLKQKVVMPSPPSSLRRAGFLAELGLRRFEEGDYDDAATLQPTYFRGPSITRPKPGKKKAG